MKIDSFKDGWSFLSNFDPSPIWFNGYLCKTLEHAYQAAKGITLGDMKNIIDCPTPSGAKKMGRKIIMRSDWDQVKLHVMKDLVRQKFHNPEYAAKLLATGTHELIEGNTWGDTFWGVCKGVGQNNLGKILMEVRQEIAQFDLLLRLSFKDLRNTP